jgi:hypothetical protein
MLDPDEMDPDPQHRYYDYLEGVSLRLEKLLGLGQVLELVRSLRLPLLQEVLEPLLTPATMIYLLTKYGNKFSVLSSQLRSRFLVSYHWS